MAVYGGATNASSESRQFLIAVALVAVVFGAISSIVHFVFNDTAMAAAIGFGAPLVVALGVKMLPRK